MKTWFRQHHQTHVRSLCTSCRQPIVLVPAVGWVLDVSGADTYDMCEGNPFGDHVPLDPNARADDRDAPWATSSPSSRGAAD